MKNSLDKTGLSLSQAASVSNILFQKASDIANQISVINNYGKSVKVDGVDYEVTQGNALPTDIVELITTKAKYHAAQAFLMENIKAKDILLKELKSDSFEYDIESPQMGEMLSPKLLFEVGDAWAREQLSLEEINDFLSNEAYAAHYGQFIHKNSILAGLRDELPTVKLLEWIEIEAGKKSPVVVKTHHTQAQLSKLHEEFSALHRNAEQKVNYYKAKMKNLTTIENARIAQLNANEQTRVNDLNQTTREIFTNAAKAWRDAKKVAESEFEVTRNNKIQEASALRIKVSPLFKETIDGILSTLEVEK